MFISHTDERVDKSRRILGQVVVSASSAAETLDENKVYDFLKTQGIFKSHPPDLKQGVIRRYGAQRVPGDPERWVYEYDGTLLLSV